MTTNSLKAWAEDLNPSKLDTSKLYRLSRTGNLVRVEKGICLAKDTTMIMKDWHVAGRASGIEFLDIHLNGLYAFLGSKRRSKPLSEMLDCVFATLVNCAATGDSLLYGRNSSGTKGNRGIINISDYLESQGFVINLRGKNNQWERNSSFMVTTEKFKVEIERVNVRVALRKGSDALEVRSKEDDKGNRKPLSLARIKLKKPKMYNDVANSVNTYNKLWLDHEVTLDGLHVVPFCKRLFNENLSLGGRFYHGGHIGLPKLDRQRLLIDGQPTIEPDFKALHPCLLYALVGIHLDPILNDPYKIPLYDRDVVKLACLSFINGNRKGFIGNVTKSGNPHNKAMMVEYRQKRITFEQRRSQGLDCDPPKKPKWAKGFIKGMPDNIKGKDLYRALIARHEPIAHLINSPNIGLTLQNIDSNIMAKVLNILCDQDIPALPVHDSVRVKVSDLNRAIGAMKCAYFESMSMDIVVDYEGKNDKATVTTQPTVYAGFSLKGVI